jgi:hypothetical protein
LGDEIKTRIIAEAHLACSPAPPAGRMNIAFRTQLKNP